MSIATKALLLTVNGSPVGPSDVPEGVLASLALGPLPEPVCAECACILAEMGRFGQSLEVLELHAGRASAPRHGASTECGLHGP